MPLNRIRNAAVGSSKYVWTSLRSMRNLGVPVREDAVTAFMLGKFAQSLGKHHVRYWADRSAFEAREGTDFEVYLCDQHGYQIDGWAFQAKLPLPPGLRSGPRARYLNYVVKKTQCRQIDLLKAHSANSHLSPYYLFYLGWPGQSLRIPGLPAGGRQMASYGMSAVPLDDVQPHAQLNGSQTTGLNVFSAVIRPWEELFQPPVGGGANKGGTPRPAPSGPGSAGIFPGTQPSTGATGSLSPKAAVSSGSLKTAANGGHDRTVNMGLRQNPRPLLPWYVSALLEAQDLAMRGEDYLLSPGLKEWVRQTATEPVTDAIPESETWSAENHPERIHYYLHELASLPGVRDKYPDLEVLLRNAEYFDTIVHSFPRALFVVSDTESATVRGFEE